MSVQALCVIPLAERLIALLLRVLTNTGNVVTSRDDAHARLDVLGCRAAVFDTLHSLILYRQKAKAFLGDPDVQVALLDAYNRLQDGGWVFECVRVLLVSDVVVGNVVLIARFVTVARFGA